MPKFEQISWFHLRSTVALHKVMQTLADIEIFKLRTAAKKRILQLKYTSPLSHNAYPVKYSLSWSDRSDHLNKKIPSSNLLS